MQGPIASLLTAERVILNVIQRMSGIATMTRKAVLALDSSHTRICDTRKTMPGLRMFDKHAVVCGGGFNHRFGLYDGVMIKDNHIVFAGSITKAVTSVKEKLGHMVKVEVETETEEQVREHSLLVLILLCSIIVRQMKSGSFQKLYQVLSLQKLQGHHN